MKIPLVGNKAIILQWGLVPLVGSLEVNFLIPFPTFPFSIYAMAHTTLEATHASVAIVNGYLKSKEKALLMCARTVNGIQQSYERSVFWLAIGSA
ncbi:gp53-like domain-containing protein [Hafnia alvei]